jgi:hypothetical protein
MQEAKRRFHQGLGLFWDYKTLTFLGPKIDRATPLDGWTDAEPRPPPENHQVRQHRRRSMQGSDVHPPLWYPLAPLPTRTARARDVKSGTL